LIASSLALAIEVPPLRGRVNDYAGVMSQDQVRALESQLAQFEQETGHQIAVLTIPTLDGEDIEGFSIRVAEQWKLGHKGKDACVEPARYKKVFKNAGWISPVVLVDGQVAGTWSLERGARGLVARVAAFRTLAPAVRKAIGGEAEVLGAFAETNAKVRYGKPARPKARMAWTGP